MELLDLFLYSQCSNHVMFDVYLNEICFDKKNVNTWEPDEILVFAKNNIEKHGYITRKHVFKIIKTHCFRTQLSSRQNTNMALISHLY